MVACHSGEQPVQGETGGKEANVETDAGYDEGVALELAEWGMPVVSFFAQKEANLRDMGAHPNEILYWSQPLDHNNKILTPNDVVLYISAQIETFDGPMVLEVPPTEGALRIFGSLVDPFMVPLEDVGGAMGVDGGKGEDFVPTEMHSSVATSLERRLQADFRHVGDRFSPGAHWTTPVKPSEPATRFTYVDEFGNYDWKTRAQTFHWAIWAPKNLGSDSFYLIGQRDDKGEVLRSS